MPKAGFIVTRVSFLILAASMLVVAMLAGPAAAGQTCTCSSSSKCVFAVSVSPSSPAAGVSTPFVFTIKNEASHQRLGSVKISAPAGFVITGASGTASVTSSSALFVNLSLAPGASTAVTVTATVPCGPSTYQWGIEAKPSNDFSGTGHDFQLDPASAGNLKGTLMGSCTIQPCPPGNCVASTSSASTSGTVTTSSAAQGDSIETGMESASHGSSFSFSCGTYKPVSDAFGFTVFNAAAVPQSTLLKATLTIDKSLVESSGRHGASSWQICYASTSSFTALPGTSGTTSIGGVTYNTGLLPACSSHAGAPCVQARNKSKCGDVLVTFLAIGDPYGRG
jgi:hypothetical protein